MAGHSKHAANDANDFVLFSYKTGEYEFILAMKNEKWGMWENTDVPLDTKLINRIKKHNELNKLYKLFLKGGASVKKDAKAISLTSTSTDLVAKDLSTNIDYEISTVTFLPNDTLRVSWRMFPVILLDGLTPGKKLSSATLKSNLKAFEAENLKLKENNEKLENEIERLKEEMEQVKEERDMLQQNARKRKNEEDETNNQNKKSARMEQNDSSDESDNDTDDEESDDEMSNNGEEVETSEDEDDEEQEENPMEIDAAEPQDRIVEQNREPEDDGEEVEGEDAEEAEEDPEDEAQALPAVQNNPVEQNQRQVVEEPIPQEIIELTGSPPRAVRENDDDEIQILFANVPGN